MYHTHDYNNICTLYMCVWCWWYLYTVQVYMMLVISVHCTCVHDVGDVCAVCMYYTQCRRINVNAYHILCTRSQRAICVGTGCMNNDTCWAGSQNELDSSEPRSKKLISILNWSWAHNNTECTWCLNRFYFMPNLFSYSDLELSNCPRDEKKMRTIRILKGYKLVLSSREPNKSHKTWRVK